MVFPLKTNHDHHPQKKFKVTRGHPKVKVWETIDGPNITLWPKCDVIPPTGFKDMSYRTDQNGT